AVERSLALRRAVAAADPASARARRLLLQTWERVFAAHRAAGNTAEARVAAYRALDLATELEAADRLSATAKRDLAVAYGNWGVALADAGERFAPLIAWHKSLDAYAGLAGRPGFPPTARDREDEAAAAT